MTQFHDISKFSDTSKYLPILNGSLTTEITMLYMIITKFIKSKSLIDWYNDFSVSAILADVLIVVIGIIIATLIYPFFFSKFYLLAFVFLSICIQVIHDILFYFTIQSIPRGRSRIFDVFQDYAKSGPMILFADACIMVSTTILGSYYASFGLNENIILLIVQLYMIPYLLYSI
jgi:uncharacterized protein YacL